VGTAATALVARALRQRGGRGLLTGALGAALLARTASSRSLGRYTTLDGRRAAVSIRKGLHIQAPVEEVFRLWSRPESFPRFMTHVKRVRRIGDHLYNWRVTGPLRTAFEWDAALIEVVPNELLAWRTLEGSDIQSAGKIRFSSEAEGSTLVEIQFSYHPPGGVVGHGLATLLGAGPKKQIDEDLLRLKSLLETGRATGRHETVTREEILRLR
jgi:uncharacterized membrane protein